VIRYPSPRPAQGFTAIEMSMVATVIAILALLILPMFQRQTEEARITAAEADIRTLGIAQQLAFSQTNRYFTLSSLDNSDFFDGNSAAAELTTEVPVVTWNDALTETERAALAQNWAGPYASFSEINITRPALVDPIFFRGAQDDAVTGAGANGPINQQVDGAFTGGGRWANERIPLDPWGSPYLFYGPDYYHPPTGLGGIVGNESQFRNFLIRSLGPDGIPGGAPAAFGAADLMRENFDPNNSGDDVFRLF